MGVGAGTLLWYAARKFFLKNTKPTSYTTLSSLFTPFILQYFLPFSPLQYMPFALFRALCYTIQRNKEAKMLVYVSDPATMFFAAYDSVERVEMRPVKTRKKAPPRVKVTLMTRSLAGEVVEAASFEIVPAGVVTIHKTPMDMQPVNLCAVSAPIQQELRTPAGAAL